jgi:hypothetical protein
VNELESLWDTLDKVASDFPLGLSAIFVRNDPKNHFTILRVSIPRLNLEIRSSNQNLQLRRPQILRLQILTIGQSYSFLVGFVAIQMSAVTYTTMATLSPSPLSADGEKNVAVPVESFTLFPKLATELRLKIWKMELPGPRVVVMDTVGKIASTARI